MSNLRNKAERANLFRAMALAVNELREDPMQAHDVAESLEYWLSKHTGQDADEYLEGSEYTLRTTKEEYEAKKLEIESFLAENDGEQVDVEADGEYVKEDFSGIITSDVKVDTDGSYYVTVVDVDDNYFDVDIMDINL